MTRQDVLTTLGQSVTGRLCEAHPSWTVEADGARYDVEVRPSGEDRDPMDDTLEGMSERERDAFFRDLEDAADEAEREGPVPAEGLRHSLDEAKARGLKV